MVDRLTQSPTDGLASSHFGKIYCIYQNRILYFLCVNANILKSNVRATRYLFIFKRSPNYMSDSHLFSVSFRGGFNSSHYISLNNKMISE
jgi:hypothetical protein